MKKNNSLLAMVLCSYSFFAQPTITTFSPASGPVGTTVTITGTNFDLTPSNNVVFFGATMAGVNAATATSLIVNVPSEATYNYISVTNLSTHLTAYSAQPFIVSFTCGNPISFAPKADSATGLTPYGIAIGDIDGDGKADLAVSNVGATSVSVLRNTSSLGIISFAPKIDFTVGGSPMSVAIGDIDGDGKPDLVASNYYTDNVSVLRNTSSSGTISFAAQVTFGAGSRVYFVAINDINGDGKPDLIVANHGVSTGSAGVLKNTGSTGTISFAQQVTFSAGYHPNNLAVGDLNGDGKPEIAVACHDISTGNAYVLKNTGSGGTISFSVQSFPTTGIQDGVAIADVNGDGKPDLILANADSTVSILKNTGSSGTISFAGTVNFTTGTGPDIISVSDLNGDGMPDIAVANYNSNTVSTLQNTSSAGTISFAGKIDFVTGTSPYCTVSGDLDGDEMPELAVVNQGSNTVSILKNQSCSALGIETISVSGFSIFPNPTSGFLYLNSSNAIAPKATIKIFNLLGEEKFYSILPDQKTNIDVSQFANGIYVIEITNGNNLRREKFVKD